MWQMYEGLTGQDHLFAAAGTGKTFIAIAAMLELLLPDEPTEGGDADAPILFAASAEPLAITSNKGL